MKINFITKKSYIEVEKITELDGQPTCFGLFLWKDKDGFHHRDGLPSHICSNGYKRWHDHGRQFGYCYCETKMSHRCRHPDLKNKSFSKDYYRSKQ